MPLMSGSPPLGYLLTDRQYKSEATSMLTSLFLAAAMAGVGNSSDHPTTAPSLVPGLGNELLPPVRIEAAGKPIDTETGHAAPFVGDFDGDGVPDLLVGQFGEGKLTIYRNIGTAAAPSLASGQVFKDGADLGRVPAG